ncbi:MAG: glycosyl hydrolase-related protein [Opitutales bacterium]
MNGQTVTLALLNAQSHYRHHPNTALAGQGRRTFHYALWPHAGPWQQASIPRRAWEYNTPVIAQARHPIAQTASFLETSPNVIVEALRRVGPDIEVRGVECAGVSGAAWVRLNLPHRDARQTNLLGENPRSLAEIDGRVSLNVRPQQIVTLRFATEATVAVPPAIRSWEALVPSAKLAAFRRHSAAQGYPGGDPQVQHPGKPD